MINQKLSRRGALKSLTATGMAVAASSKIAEQLEAANIKPVKLKGNVNHSVCKWCYSKLSLEELAEAASEFGMHSIELLTPDQFPIIKKYGLACAMSNGPGGNTKGFNRIEHHAQLVEGFERMIPQVAAAGFPNIICFSGNRDGLDDDEGLENCAIGLEKVMKTAEKFKVTVCMELLNSKVNHKDYQCDHTEWGVALAKRIGSDRFKLLYDI